MELVPSRLDSHIEASGFGVPPKSTEYDTVKLFYIVVIFYYEVIFASELFSKNIQHTKNYLT